MLFRADHQMFSRKNENFGRLFGFFQNFCERTKIKVAWMSTNFERLHEILNEANSTNSAYLMWNPEIYQDPPNHHDLRFIDSGTMHKTVLTDSKKE